MTYKLTNCLKFPINLSSYLSYHVKMSPRRVVNEKAFDCWFLGKRALVSQIHSVVVHYYISLCHCSSRNNFQFCSPFAILPHLICMQILFTVHLFLKKNVQVIIMYLFEITYCLAYCKVVGFYSC